MKSAQPGRARGRAPSTEKPPTTGARLRALRDVRGWSQRLLAKLIARDTGQGEAAWQSAIARYETDVEEPSADRLAILLSHLEVSDASRCAGELSAALPPPTLARLVDSYGPDVVVQELRRLAGMLELTAPLLARQPTRRRSRASPARNSG